MNFHFETEEDAIRAMPTADEVDLTNYLVGEGRNLKLKYAMLAELLRRQKQRHLDLIAAYAKEMEAVNGTLNGGPYHEGASLAARHLLNLIRGT